jgi:citrate synthase
MPPEPSAGQTLSAREAAALLGVKLPTLYAYVSRGLVRSTPAPRGRARRYRREDVERLAFRHRGGGRRIRSPLSWGEPLLETAITRLSPDGPVYRGHRLDDLVTEGLRFEAVAELLWGGGVPETDDEIEARWTAADLGVDAAAVARLIPDGATPMAALQVLVPALALADPGRYDPRREAVLPRARALIRRLAAGIGLPDAGRANDALQADSVAQAVAVSLGARSAHAVRAVETALVVCADHELNASTFAARVTASTRADVYACVGSALCALSGPLHGSVSEQVEALLIEIGRPERAEAVIHERLRRGEHIPGFGHPFYRQLGDPRARLLLDAAQPLGTRSRSARALAGLIEAARAAQRPPPNLDVGLVAVSAPLGLRPGAAAGLFAVGRAAGWVAHALEQVETGHLLRPRARYAGPDAPGEEGMLA